ncbi:MAG TPA: outer membrane lipid asymmetry maintenance protein MlaD [Rhodanobacteraceae bacterium]|jgi:phospholipid/cholesterol/gamma-HCH transport system substrate-binding protein|nr:outer membrane lipid asymmetry maintenance protein MlaD [Rhodanobacteraceae bacterium]
MNPRPSYAIGTGLFILLGFAALAYLATQTTSVANGMTSSNTYAVKARFGNIGQLKERAPVKIAGVRIGDVQSITLEPQRMDALVVMSIDKRYSDIPEDSAAAIFTSGLLGDQYVGIQPGGSPEFLKDGDEMVLTQSAMSIENLIGKFMVNGGSSSSGSGAAPASSAPPASRKP